MPKLNLDIPAYIGNCMTWESVGDHTVKSRLVEHAYDDSRAKSQTGGVLLLTTDNVYFSYGEKTIIKGLNLSLSQGDTLGVVGDSGCGKSTLLYLLSGLKKPISGVVRMEDKDLWESREQRLLIRRRDFGFVFQQHFLINYLTVLENVLVPSFSPKNDEKKALELLGVLGMGTYENKFPYQLSGGQRQRVAIARALINAPKVIFADEPTASLDLTNSKLVIELLKDYQRKHNSALVFVTHDLSLVESFDHVLKLAS